MFYKADCENISHEFKQHNELKSTFTIFVSKVLSLCVDWMRIKIKGKYIHTYEYLSSVSYACISAIMLEEQIIGLIYVIWLWVGSFPFLRSALFCIFDINVHSGFFFPFEGTSLYSEKHLEKYYQDGNVAVCRWYCVIDWTACLVIQNFLEIWFEDKHCDGTIVIFIIVHQMLPFSYQDTRRLLQAYRWQMKYKSNSVLNIVATWKTTTICEQKPTRRKCLNLFPNKMKWPPSKPHHKLYDEDMLKLMIFEAIAVPFY